MTDIRVHACASVVFSYGRKKEARAAGETNRVEMFAARRTYLCAACDRNRTPDLPRTIDLGALVP
jgi:hypothetical protein